MSPRTLQPTDISFNNVVDLYLKERRNGNLLTISTLETAFPHLANEIHVKFPAIMMLDDVIGGKANQTEALEGQVLGGCKIVQEIGRGAMGVVYEAIQQEMNRRVALKVIPLESEAADRFVIERHAMARLEHPHILPVYSSGREGNRAFLIMKLIDGKSFHDLHNGEGDILQRAHFSALQTDWQALSHLGATIAAGLHQAHQQGMVHRDVKPGNLILDRDGKAWIIDFGLARIIDNSRSLSRTGDVIGTPRYMAPEQARGLCDARSDVYSLGITLYELVTGEKVWEERSAGSMVVNRGSLTLPELREIKQEVPEGLSSIIMKACQFDPEHRYQTAYEMSVVLNRFASGRALGDRRKRGRESDHVYKQKLKYRTAMTIVGGAATAFVVSTVVLLPRLNQPEKGPATLASTAISAPAPTKQKSGANLIDKLADSTEDDMVQVVLDFVDDSIKESTEELNFSQSAERRLLGEVKKITNSIKGDGLTKEKLEEFLEGYRKSALPTATKIMRLSHLITNSGLAENDRAIAVETLRQLASSVANKAVSESDALQLVDHLLPHGYDVRAISDLKVSDAQLQEWLKQADLLIANVPESLRQVDWQNSLPQPSSREF